MIALLNGVLFAYALTSVVELKQVMKLMTDTIDQDTAGHDSSARKARDMYLADTHTQDT